MHPPPERFKIKNESLSGHGCCFRYSIIDTNINANNDFEKVVCECWNKTWAIKIKKLLNGHFNKYRGK